MDPHFGKMSPDIASVWNTVWYWVINYLNIHDARDWKQTFIPIYFETGVYHNSIVIYID